ncbi:MAG TPA: DUF3054 domain-containing protein [Dermatophilaceae bacterium]|nr:DUF3054 domain-containing protein [Dermatophilaceae bacterium]
MGQPVRMPWALLLDLVLVIVFAAIGRASHAEQNAVLGALSTAAPFLVGTLAGWALVRARSRSWPLTVGTGIPVWLSTLGLGMLLRVLFGGSTAVSFILVAGAALAILLLGWRWVASWWARRAAQRG